MQSQPTYVLSCKKISKSFNQHSVLKDINFTLFKDEKVGLVGSNGSGKTTLLKICCGLIESDDGVITISKKITTGYLPQLIDDESTTLSGGEKAKKALQALMTGNIDLYFLDEPTNNLDTEGLTMIEDFILHSEKTFFIISHDREFLDRTVSKIIEIDETTKKSNVYDGNYSAYVEQKRAMTERAWQIYSDKVEKTKKFTNSIDQKVSWMGKIEEKRMNIRNLPIHEREKGTAAYLRDKEAKMGRRARIIKDKLESYKEDTETIEKPSVKLPINISFDIDERSGDKVFMIRDVIKNIGTKTIGPVTLDVIYGDSILISGSNGTGKTTFLKMLIAETIPDEGTIVKGKHISLGYIPQHRQEHTQKSFLDEESSAYNNGSHTVLESFLSLSDIDLTNARKILNRYDLSGKVHKHVADISPGEYSRLIIGALAARKPNCIILDEPTNHLDLTILEELELALREYEGTLIVVSHDRYFIKQVGFKKIYNL